MPKKPLQPLLFGRPLWPLFNQSITALFESLSAKDIAGQFVALANTGDSLATNWLKRLLDDRRGTIDALANSEAVGLQWVPQKKGNRIVWRYVYRGGYRKDDLYAWALIRVIQEGTDRRIKRCPLKDCQKIFFGDVRAKWCSPGCGSLYRVRKKRREDQQ